MQTTKLDVADRMDIHDLFARYCFLVDENRADEWVALFTPDGVFDVPGLARMEGREQVRRIIEMVSANSKGKWRHQLTNILAEPAADADSATFKIYGLVTDWSGNGAVSTFNDYSGKLRKIDGEWRIAEIVARAAKITV